MANLFLKVVESLYTEGDEDDIPRLTTLLTDQTVCVTKGKNHEVTFSDLLNSEMIDHLNRNYKPEFCHDIDSCCSFNVLEIGEKFCSAHYGRELYLTNLTPDERGEVEQILQPLYQFLKIDRFKYE